MRSPILLTGVGLLLVGCTTAQPTAPSPQTTTPMTPPASAPASSPGATGGGATPTRDAAAQAEQDARVASAKAAATTAQQSLSGLVTKVEWDDGHWEVEVLVGDLEHEIDLTPDGTQVTHTDSDPDRVNADEVARLNAARITVADAIDKGLVFAPGLLKEADLDPDRAPATGAHWEVTVDQGGAVTTVVLDGSTGERR